MPMMNTAPLKCFFVEKFHPQLRFEISPDVIALTPQASYELDRAGINYTIPEDYGIEEELKAHEASFFKEQLAWFSQLDTFIKENVPLCAEKDINLATACYLRIKYLVDFELIQYRLFQKIIIQKSPSEIIFLGKIKNQHPECNIYRPPYKEDVPYENFLQLICETLQIPWRSYYCGEESQTLPHRLNSTKVSSIRKFVKWAYYFFYYQKFQQIVSGKSKNKKLTIFSVDAGSSDIDLRIRQLIKMGHRVFIKDADRIFFINRLLGIYNRPESQRKKDIFESFKGLYSKFFHQGLWRTSLHKKWGMETNPISFPYLEHFFENLCPSILSETDSLMPFFDHHNVDYVIARASSSERAVSALLASKISRRTRNVCFQHGCLAIEEKAWYVTELEPFDIYFASDIGSFNYFVQNARISYSSNCHVSTSSDRLIELQKKVKKTRRKKPVLIYANKGLSGFRRHFHNLVYPVTWYYQFQKALLQELARHDNYKIIFKQRSEQPWAKDSILKLIKELGCRNIGIEEKPLVECLNKSDKLLLDYPSTGFFEGAAMGIPVMSLCHQDFIIPDAMRKIFGCSLQFFGSITEAIDKVRWYLESDPQQFLVSLPLSNNDFIETLQKMCVTPKAEHFNEDENFLSAYEKS